MTVKTIVILALLSLPFAPLLVFNSWFNQHLGAWLALAVVPILLIWVYLYLEGRSARRS